MTTPAPPRKRRWLRGVLSVLAGLLLALIALVLTRSMWLGPTLSRVASRATGKTCIVRDVALRAVQELAEPAARKEIALEVIADPMIAMHAAVALQAALEHRDRTGEGQMIEVAQLETACCLTADQPMDFQCNGRLGTRSGNRDARMAPQGVYRCEDGDWVALTDETREVRGLLGDWCRRRGCHEELHDGSPTGPLEGRYCSRRCAEEGEA